MTWTLLYEGTTGFDWVTSVPTDTNLLRVTHLDLVIRGSLIGYSSGRTEIAQFNEAEDSFFEPKIIRSEVESQIIQFPKLSLFQVRKIGVRNGFGFDPQRIKVEGMSVGLYYETSQVDISQTINKQSIPRKNLAQELLPENFSRKGLSIRNDSKVSVNINYLGDATVTDFIVVIPSKAVWEMQPNFIGRISAWFVGSNASQPNQIFGTEALTVMEFL